MLISLIVAMARANQAIGYKNKLLWHIPEDLKLFKKLTMGHTLIMGRKTFDSIIESLGRPLPNRDTIVITRDINLLGKNSQIPSVCYFSNIAGGIKFCKEQKNSEIFVCGGGQIYKEALPCANKLYLSLVDYVGPADTFFPKLNWDEWQVESEKQFPDFTHKILLKK